VDSGIVIVVTLNEEGEYYADAEIQGGLAVGASEEITFQWHATAQGVYNLEATHDLVDGNTYNNASSTIVTVETADTDIALTHISAPASVSEGESVNVVVTVENVGNQDVLSDITIDFHEDGIFYDSGTITGGLTAGASAPVAITWNAASQGTYELEAVNRFPDDDIANDTISTTVEVTPPQIAGPHLRTGTVCVSTTGWTTVTLDHTYTNMVVVATPKYDRDLVAGTTMPVVAQVRNAYFDSFEVRLFQAVAGSIEISEAWVHFMVVERGVYNLPGVKMEADKFVSTVTDRKGSWVGQSRPYGQTYTNPVVLGQVMTYNSDLWSVFWCRGSNRKYPPSSTQLYVGKHTAEDTRTRYNEIVGYIVIEAGSGDMEGSGYRAGLGLDSVYGMGNSPPYAYPLNGLSFTPSTAIVTQAAMDGGNGGWAILHGDDPLPPDRLDLAIEEDWYWDGESSHTSEQVGYIVFEEQLTPIDVAGPVCQYLD
jgi:hypothetical protein